MVIPVAAERGRSAARAGHKRGQSAASAVELSAEPFADNGASDRSHVDRATLAGLDIRHTRT